MPGERCARVLLDTRKSDVDGVHYVFSGLPIAFFNVALVTGRNVIGNGIERLRPAGVRMGVETRRSVALCDHP